MMDKAKEYQLIRQRLTLVNLLMTPILLALFFFSGLSQSLATIVSDFNVWVSIAVYFSLFSLFFLIFDLPMSFYSGFVLEHQFKLSNLSPRGWAFEFLKKSILGFAFALLLIEALYFLIRSFETSWWVWAWVAYAGVTYVMGKLFPVFIVPLFYKYSEIEDGPLKNRILSLLERFHLPVSHLFSINLSKTTKKANACFMGVGKTKRVVLSDTLIEGFEDEEIEMVLAHELGHFKHKDILKQMFLGLGISFLTFFAAYQVMVWAVGKWSLQGVRDIAGLPILCLVLYSVHLVVMPIQNAFSRMCERAADRFALNACGKPDVFINMMEKLGKINLADPNPPAWFEWFFHSHPAMSKRIRMAEEFRGIRHSG